MNGFSTGEEDSRGPTDQICCLVDDGDVCRNAAGNASYSKRIQKTVIQRRLKLSIDPQVSNTASGGDLWAIYVMAICHTLVFFVLENSINTQLTTQRSISRRNTYTFVIFTKQEYSAQERNDDERIRKTTAMKPTPICPKWTCINCK